MSIITHHPIKSVLAALVVGALMASTAIELWFTSQPTTPEQPSSTAKQPLYWVAPMDANYRRDKPGKSPMGMDLVPVYEEDVSAVTDAEQGVVTIAAHVVNNLGVRTANVELKAMSNDISTVGYVQYDQDKLIHIHPRVDGWIEKLFVKSAGDPVEKGQALYSLYSPQLVNAQEEYLIALKRDNQALIKAAKDRLAALQLSTEFINQLAKAREVQQTVTFYSPQAGVIDGLKIREGFYVQPGTTLFSIAQLDQVWVEAEVFERDAPLMSQGLPVTMTLDYLPTKEWHGAVDYIYPRLDSKTRTLRVRLKFTNAEHDLKPDMFAQVTIHANPVEQALLVPKEAIIRTGKQDRVVLALGQGQFKSVAVNIGRVDRQYAEVLSGLSSQNTVVVSAQFLIDSESSKTADFKRLEASEPDDSIWIQGQINEVSSSQRVVNISHEPALAWDWPAMTMDFNVAESVDIEQLKPGQQLHFQVMRNNQQQVLLTAIHLMEEPEVATATVDGVINAIVPETKVINISRGPIEKWQRPAATMDFIVSEAIDLSAFSPQDSVTFTFEVRDDLVITAISLQQATKSQTAAPVSHNEH